MKHKHRSSRTWLTLWFLSALLMTCAATGASVSAQSQDPLQKKLDYLKTNLERYLSHSLGVGEGAGAGKITFEAMSFETCRITWRISTAFERSADLPASIRDVQILNQVSVDLSSIDTTRTRIYVTEQMRQRGIPWSLHLELRIRPGSPGFKQRMISTRAGRVTARLNAEQKSFAFAFNTEDQPVAEDVSKVFAEASNICRSRMQRLR